MGLMRLDEIRPPIEDTISVLAITTAASAEQDLALTPEGTGKKSYWFYSDTTCYITFSNDGISGSITNPDETAVTGSGCTFPIPANTMVPFVVSPKQRYFKAKGAASGYLRWYPG